MKAENRSKLPGKKARARPLRPEKAARASGATATATTPSSPTPPAGVTCVHITPDEVSTREPSPAVKEATKLLRSIRGPKAGAPSSPPTPLAPLAPRAARAALAHRPEGHPTRMRVDAVVVPEGRRCRADMRVVESIAESVRRRGLLSPIRVRRDGRLVSGLHRLLSHELLGLEEIEVVVVDDDASDVDVELDEVDENLCRRDLSILERALAEKRQKALYVARHEETKRGVAGAVARHDPEGLKPQSPSFAAAEAKPGSGRRMVEQRNQIAEKLGADAALLLDHPIANDHTKLVQLARVPDGARKDVVEKLARGEVKTLAEALKPPAPSVAKRRKKSDVPTQFPIVTTADGERLVHAEVRGRRLRIAMGRQLATCTVTDDGAVVEKIEAPIDDRVLTFANSLAVPDEVVRELPSDLAAYVTVSPITIEEDTSCPRCLGTSFYVARRDQELVCTSCVSYYRREAYGLVDGRGVIEGLQLPRISRRINVTSQSGATSTVCVRWWGTDSHAVQILEGHYEVEVDAPWRRSAEVFKVALRRSVLAKLAAAGYVRAVAERCYRADDGTEVSLTPICGAEDPTFPGVEIVHVIPTVDNRAVWNLSVITQWIRDALSAVGVTPGPQRGDFVDAEAARVAGMTARPNLDAKLVANLASVAAESSLSKTERATRRATLWSDHGARAKQIREVTPTLEKDIATYNDLVRRYHERVGSNPGRTPGTEPGAEMDEPAATVLDLTPSTSAEAPPWYGTTTGAGLARQLLRLLAARPAIGAASGVSVGGHGGGTAQPGPELKSPGTVAAGSSNAAPLSGGASKIAAGPSVDALSGLPVPIRTLRDFETIERRDALRFAALWRAHPGDPMLAGMISSAEEIVAKLARTPLNSKARIELRARVVGPFHTQLAQIATVLRERMLDPVRASAQTCGLELGVNSTISVDCETRNPTLVPEPPSVSANSRPADLGADESAAGAAPEPAPQQTCSACERPIAGAPYFSDDGHPVCVDCYLDLYGLGDPHAPFGGSDAADAPHREAPPATSARFKPEAINDAEPKNVGGPSHPESDTRRESESAPVHVEIPAQPADATIGPAGTGAGASVDPSTSAEDAPSIPVSATASTVSSPKPPRGRKVTDEEVITLGAELLRRMQHPTASRFSIESLARSMRTTPRTVVGLAQRFDTVLVITAVPAGWLRAAYYVLVREGCGEQLVALERKMTKEARAARRERRAKK